MFIEDRVETAIDMIKYQIPTILFNTPYNQGFEHTLLYRTDSWEEAFNFIEYFKKKRKPKPFTVLDLNI